MPWHGKCCVNRWLGWGVTFQDRQKLDETSGNDLAWSSLNGRQPVTAGPLFNWRNLMKSNMMRARAQAGFYPIETDDRCGDYWYFGCGGVAGLSGLHNVRAKLKAFGLHLRGLKDISESVQTSAANIPGPRR